MFDTVHLISISPSNLGRMCFHLGKHDGLQKAENISAAHLKQVARPHVDAGLLLIARAFNPDIDTPVTPPYIPTDEFAQWMYAAGYRFGFTRYDQIVTGLCGSGTALLDVDFVLVLTTLFSSPDIDEAGYSEALAAYRSWLSERTRPELPLETNEDQ